MEDDRRRKVLDMAGKRGGYRGGKSAYRMTARRKSALRKAQLISAKKRKRNNAIGLSVGALAVASIGATAVTSCTVVIPVSLRI